MTPPQLNVEALRGVSLLPFLFLLLLRPLGVRAEPSRMKLLSEQGGQVRLEVKLEVEPLVMDNRSDSLDSAVGGLSSCGFSD